MSELEFIGNPAYSYWWSFGDGTVSTARNPQHIYASNGTYTVALVVCDGAAKASNTLTVNVMPRPALALAGPVAGDIALSWPAYTMHYHLDVATNLAPPIEWSPVTNVVISQGGSNRVTLTIDTAGNRFFRLRTP